MQVLKTTENIFDLPTGSLEAVCVTTNGIIKPNGCAVMGKGIAKEADSRFHLAGKLGTNLRLYGNRPFYMGVYATIRNTMSIITFPTKHDWHDDSDLTLIEASVKQIINICDKEGITKCYMTPPGCGNGHLDWITQVKPLIAPLLDDRFIVVMKG